MEKTINGFDNKGRQIKHNDIVKYRDGSKFKVCALEHTIELQNINNTNEYIVIAEYHTINGRHFPFEICDNNS